MGPARTVAANCSGVLVGNRGDRLLPVTAPSIHTRELPYSPPYDWQTVLAFFRAHHLPYLEMVDDSGYERVVSMHRGLGWFRVVQHADQHALLLSVWNGNEQDVSEISKSVRNMFDLDANPDALRQAMENDAFLSRFWTEHPGLRLARSWSPSEAMFSTVLGQVVSVKFGRVLISELMQAAGRSARHPKTAEPIWLFPSAEQIIEADLSGVRTSMSRRTTIHSLAHAVNKGAFDRRFANCRKELRKALRSVPGIGAWTTEYVAMRGFGDDDAFPATDYALKQEIRRRPETDIDSVRPWRGYAAVALWKSFAKSKVYSQ
jgi:DNA-3-methyladenine glycosylase II